MNDQLSLQSRTDNFRLPSGQGSQLLAEPEDITSYLILPFIMTVMSGTARFLSLPTRSDYGAEKRFALLLQRSFETLHSYGAP
jgi:hypothetical protein